MPRRRRGARSRKGGSVKRMLSWLPGGLTYPSRTIRNVVYGHGRTRKGRGGRRRWGLL